MELKFVIPDAQGTFGNLEYAGEAKPVMGWSDGRRGVEAKVFDLYSDVQRTDNVQVRLPAKFAGRFEPGDQVKLVNPRITAEGKKAGETGYTDYIIHADDMVKL